MRKRPWLLMLFCVPALSLADEIFLKGGAKFSGRIEQQTDTMVTIDIGAGVVGVPMARVDHIVKGRSPLDEYEERAKALQPQDVTGWRNLGAYAAEHGLSAQAQLAFKKVLVAAPDDPVAREALGYVKYEGRWMTLEESYRAKGFVKYDGEWMSSADAQAARAYDDAEQARQDAEKRANQAEADKILAESRAEKAEERAREAEEVDPWTQMSTWGGWGYGWTTWPTGTINTWPNNQPNRPPQRSQP